MSNSDFTGPGAAKKAPSPGPRRRRVTPNSGGLPPESELNDALKAGNDGAPPEPTIEIQPLGSFPRVEDILMRNGVEAVAAASPEVDGVTGEPVTKPALEASPPPPQPTAKQKVSKKIDFEAIRKTRLQVTAKPNIPYRIPVIDSPSSEFFFRSHPSFGGLDDPLPIWKRSGLGKGGSGLLLVKPDVVDLVRAHGGKVAMCGIWWCQYSVGGQFLVVASAESDNDWLVTAREIYEDSRNRWLKRINVGNCWEGREPPVKLPSPEFTQLKWDEVLNLGFDTEVDENHPAFLALVYGGTPPVEEK